jgi:3-oxoacyl-[acyl-carrier protein] reductase
MNIEGKTALVLGASRGIGKAIAAAIAAKGARLVVTYFDWPEASEAMRRELEEAGFEHLAVQVDLRRPAEVSALFDRLKGNFGGLDILINNIERGGMPIVHGLYSEKQWDLEMETTLKAKWWVVHHAMPLLRAAPEGVIITLSSIAGIVGRSGPAGWIFNDGYGAANRAVSSFTETWAREGAPSVRVNELMLGICETRHGEQTRGWELLSEEQRRSIIDRTLLARTGRIDEVVAAILFLIEKATYMTGSVLLMDGGFVLGSDRVPPMPEGVEKEN